MRELAAAQPDTDWRSSTRPESFTGTELDFAVEICDAVIDVWQPTPERKVILNLPATVEMATPNIYADQIEWFGRNIAQRDSVVLSACTRTTIAAPAVAAAELALMAGADRVEGTLFGNGERTGNVDIVTLALNLFSAGRRSGARLLATSTKPRAAWSTAISCRCIRVIRTSASWCSRRSPARTRTRSRRASRRARSTATSGKCRICRSIPRDVGRTYESVIRVNSQSGKGGIAYLLERDYGLTMPRRLQIEFSQVVQAVTDATGKELTSEQIWSLFEREYLGENGAYVYGGHQLSPVREHQNVERLTLKLKCNGQGALLHGDGNGPIDAIVDALGLRFDVLSYEEHSMGSGSDARAVAFVEITTPARATLFGVGLHENIVTASLMAVLSAVNRALQRGLLDDSMPAATAG